MGIKGNLLVQATKYNSKRGVEFALNLYSFARRNEPSHSRENNQHLNSALTVAIENLNFDIVELLVNAGADVNLLDKNNKNAITHAVERIATSKGLSVDPSKDLPEEIISHPIVQFLLVKGSKYHSTDNMDTEEGHASSIRGDVEHSRNDEHIHQEPVEDDEHIYEEIDNFRGNEHIHQEPIRDDEHVHQEPIGNNEHIHQEPIRDDEHVHQEPVGDNEHIHQEPVEDDEHIYEEIDHFCREPIRNDEHAHRESVGVDEHTHLGLIGGDEHAHLELIGDDESAYEEPIGYNRHSYLELIRDDEHIHQEPAYATVDLAAKRSERKAKSIKASSGIYRGLVEDRKNQWEEKISKCKSEAYTTAGRKEELQVNTRKASGANIERIKQKCESGYDSDTKVEQSKNPRSPNSEANAVYIEYGVRVIGGYRYKITDVSLYVSTEACRMQIKPMIIDSSKQEHAKISDGKEHRNSLHVNAEACTMRRKLIASSKQEHTKILDSKEHRNPLYANAEACRMQIKPIGLSKQEHTKILDSKEYRNPLYANAEVCRMKIKLIDSSKQEHTKIPDSKEHRNPLYVNAEACRMQIKSVDSTKPEPTYTAVDLVAKRSERKAKSIKASSGVYRGLVKDRKNQWEEKINKCKSGANTTTGRKEKLQANTRKLPESPNSEANSVHVEHGVIRRRSSI